MIRTNKDFIDLKLALKLIDEHEVNNKNRLQKLEDYYMGKHEILNRYIEDPSKPNNKVISNLPKFCVDIRSGYFSGNAISFTSLNENMANEINEVLTQLEFEDVNADLDNLTSIFGYANLTLFNDEEGVIKVVPTSPLNSFVVYDNSLIEKPVGAIYYKHYVEDNKSKLYLVIYNRKNIQTFDGNLKTPTLVKNEPNYFGGVPMIEFLENKERKGSFEDAISIVDAIEQIQSSSVNEIEYFDNAYLVLQGLSATTQEDIQDMKNNRVMLVDGDGSATFLTKQVNDTYIQNMLDRLTGDFHKLTQTPNLTDESFAGNVSGVAMQFKMFGLEKSMQMKQNKWEKSIKQMLQLIANLMNMRGANINVDEIDMTFTRSLPTNTQEIVSMVQQLNGIVSNETLLAQLPFIDNPKEELEKVNDEKMANVDMFEFETTPMEDEEEPIVGE